jgi:hypothetical protein
MKQADASFLQQSIKDVPIRQFCGQYLPRRRTDKAVIQVRFPAPDWLHYRSIDLDRKDRGQEG